MEATDPFAGENWIGWARFGRGVGCTWHRVIVAPPDEFGRPTGYLPVCKSRRDPMPPTTEVFDYRWAPHDLERCFDCWPEGLLHPGSLSDMPPGWTP